MPASLFRTLGLALLAALIAAPSAAPAQSLQEIYQSQRERLANNAFNAPINLVSDVTDKAAQGEVYAVLATPFETLRAVMSAPSQWCEIVLLHVNVKACTYRDEPSADLRFYVGHKEYETPDQAYALEYDFRVATTTPSELLVSLSAVNGPFGTSGYHMQLEAIPIDEERSFLHFSYSYNYNWMSKIALDAYLATLGRHKVGFTVTGQDERHQPVYIKGIQGIVERNSMRYFLAIQATLGTINTPQDNVEARLNAWYDLIQHYPRQLVEYTRDEYLDRKRLEHQNQTRLQQNEKRPAVTNG